ncbi:arsenical efflux pump membrane protein ArsB [Cohnella fermenti]|uniref:Arsenical efflux pump membrane protein ArsB n=1 Tax=Cohnella fermenti TaxID=2565925 RepID=A0A4S4C6V2_9BACL|nr:ArsB/NhaD family transporter [Cohnella fermenti]THF83348.1 arsenical efflux pump membrane protein ArsB [Cohnella fermenti]
MAIGSSIAVFLLTLLLIIVKPRQWHEAVFAVPAAALLLLLGNIGLEDASYIWGLVWNATLSLIGIMILTAVLDDIGFFRWAALHIVRRFGRRPLLLLAGFAGLASLITTFFNNDGTVLIMTPIVLEATALLGMSLRGRLAFLLGIGLMADTASATLLVSNLTNILTADYFGISFGDYARHMLLPGITAVLATIGVLLLAFRRSLLPEATDTSGSFPVPEAADTAGAFPIPATAIADRFSFRFSWLVLVSILVLYLFGERLGVPVSVVACGGALLLWALAAARGSIGTKQIASRAPWLIVVFAFAMNLVVYSLHLHGATAWFPKLLEPLLQQGPAASIFGTGILVSLLAAVLNNLPAVLISSMSITEAGGGELLPFAALLGLTIGAKLTPIGSLATLLWLGLLRRDGIKLSWGEYMKVGALLALPVLLLSLGALWLQTLLLSP